MLLSPLSSEDQAVAANHWLLQALLDRCHAESAALLRRSTTAHERASKYQPWLLPKRDLSAAGWAVYFTALCRESALLKADNDSDAREAAVTTNRLLEVLLDVPMSVDGLDVVRVYPKSLHSIGVLANIQAEISALDEQLRDRFQSALQGKTLDELLASQTKHKTFHQMLAWSATYPEPSLPFTQSTKTPRPPLYICNLSVERMVLIAEAVNRLHSTRIQFCTSIRRMEGVPVAADELPLRALFEPFIHSISEQVELSVETLERDRSLPSLLGLAVVADEISNGPGSHEGLPS